jgi:exodeoxyribonuclease VII small subunit
MKFETALAELEDIVSSMEGGKLELEAPLPPTSAAWN